MSGSIAPKIVTDGLVVFLDTNNTNSYSGSGDTWYNLYRYKTDLTLSGPLVYSSLNKTLTFNGSTTYAYSSNFYPIEGPATICVAIRPTSTGSNRTFFSVSNATGASGDWGGIQAGYRSGLSNVFSVWKMGGTILSQIGSLPVNNWHYACITYSTTKLSVYVNGQLVNTVLSPELQTGSGRILVGTYRHLPSPLEVFAGSFGVFQYYNRELSDYEILQNYNFFKPIFNF